MRFLFSLKKYPLCFLYCGPAGNKLSQLLPKNVFITTMVLKDLQFGLYYLWWNVNHHLYYCSPVTNGTFLFTGNFTDFLFNSYFQHFIMFLGMIFFVFILLSILNLVSVCKYLSPNLIIFSYYYLKYFVHFLLLHFCDSNFTYFVSFYTDFWIFYHLKNLFYALSGYRIFIYLPSGSLTFVIYTVLLKPLCESFYSCIIHLSSSFSIFNS